MKEGDVMCKRLVNSLVLVGVVATLVATLATEATAATCTTSKTLSTQSCCSWKTTSSGVKYCALWCTGSQICVNTIFGLSGNIVKDCTPGETCPVTECSAYGTAEAEGTVGSCDESLDNLNPTCGIEGVAVCTNPNNHFNVQGTPYTLSGIEQTIGDVKTCDKKGKCTNQLKLEPTNTSEICINPNWHFLTFTASKFKGKTCFCPGGYDNTTDPGPQCCADSSRKTDGTCVTKYGTGDSIGTPTCLKSFCSVDLSTYDPFTNFDLPYDCQTAETCGGVSGTLCP